MSTLCAMHYRVMTAWKLPISDRHLSKLVSVAVHNLGLFWKQQCAHSIET